jgi:hypothetical protein
MITCQLSKLFMVADLQYVDGSPVLDHHSREDGKVSAYTQHEGVQALWYFPGQEVSLDEVEGCGTATLKNGATVNVQFRMSTPLTTKDIA